MRYVLDDEAAISCFGEDMEKVQHRTALEVHINGVAVAIDQQNGIEVQTVLLSEDRHLLPLHQGNGNQVILEFTLQTLWPMLHVRHQARRVRKKRALFSICKSAARVRTPDPAL